MAPAYRFVSSAGAEVGLILFHFLLKRSGQEGGARFRLAGYGSTWLRLGFVALHGYRPWRGVQSESTFPGADAPRRAGSVALFNVAGLVFDLAPIERESFRRGLLVDYTMRCRPVLRPRGPARCGSGSADVVPECGQIDYLGRLALVCHDHNSPFELSFSLLMRPRTEQTTKSHSHICARMSRSSNAAKKRHSGGLMPAMSANGHPALARQSIPHPV